jgi:hypothetical protein
MKAEISYPWLKEAVHSNPVTVLDVLDNGDVYMLYLKDSKGELCQKECSKKGKFNNFMCYRYGTETEDWKGKSLTFGKVDKYYLPVKGE